MKKITTFALVGAMLCAPVAFADGFSTVEVANAYDYGTEAAAVAAGQENTTQIYYADLEDWYAGFLKNVPPALNGNVATVGDGVELPSFLLYDIDITGYDLLFTLIEQEFNNVGVPSNGDGEPTQADTYYIEFDVAVADVVLSAASDNFNIELEVIEAGTSFDLPDAFGLNGGEAKTLAFENGGIAVRVASGTLLNDVVGNSFTVSVTPAQ